ncbi:hypothetical protein Tco_0672338 [Tanacetum coccineum]
MNFASSNTLQKRNFEGKESKEDEAKEAGSVKSSATENKDHEMTVEKEEEFKKLKKKPKKKRIITGTL